MNQTLSLKEIVPPCASLPLDEADKLFFSEASEKRIAQAKALCATCPMIQACLDHAIKSECEFGIFGGLTPEERKAL
jgi:WhiB family redox-sensing transcriptional regulator